MTLCAEALDFEFQARWHVLSLPTISLVRSVWLNYSTKELTSLPPPLDPPGSSHTPAPGFCVYSSLCLDTLLLDALPSAYQQFAPVFHLVHRRCVVLSRVWLSETWWTGAHQALLSMGYPRQRYWNGLPFPSPGHLGSNPYLLHWQADSLPLSHPGSPIISFQITSLETFQLLSLSLPCFVLLHSTISYWYFT